MCLAQREKSPGLEQSKSPNIRFQFYQFVSKYKSIQSTVDQIMTVVCTASINEKLNKPTIDTHGDIKACFDRIRLNSVLLDVGETGSDLKALKVMSDFTNETVIKISGDPNKNR